MQPNSYPDLTKKNPFRHKKLLIITSILVTIFIVIPLFFIAWLGFIPGLSQLLGASKAQDLGVRYTLSDLSAYESKTKINFAEYTKAPISINNSAQKSVLQNPINTAKMIITQEELTAILNNSGLSWLPMKNIQARISEDTVEISANIDTAKLDDFGWYLDDINSYTGDAHNAISWAQRFSNNAPIYLRANAQILNNNLVFQMKEATIGKISIPLGDTGDNLSTQSQSYIKTDTFDAKSVKLSDGNLEFVGIYPSLIYIQ